MKILRIAGRNLASLAAEFQVDFQSEPLASSGLFAICGPTGAGKSTLLDALCLALYDATPRLLRANRIQLQDVGTNTVSMQDPRSLLRRGAGDGHAEVDFVGNDGVTYRARWSVRRARGKAAGALQPSAMTLHRLPELQAIGGTKTEVALEIAARIGLTFDQFTRAVLLAQNEFSAFLKTDDNERGELLETLTGSDVYSDLSRRAFARHRLEGETLARMTARLADQTPLAHEIRIGIEAENAAAQAALHAIEVRRADIEQQLRWYQEAERLGSQVTLAEAALLAARAGVDAAQDRRRHLASIDALQPARVLLAEATRLALEQAATGRAQHDATLALERSVAARTAVAVALTQAQDRVTAAEDAVHSAAPALDQAKALDAALAALADPHRQARQTFEGATVQAQAAQAALDAKIGAIARSRAEHQQASEWLEQQRQWETLALQWPRWDALLAQGEQAAGQQAGVDAALTRAAQGFDTAVDNDAASARALDQSALKLAERDSARLQAIQLLAPFDMEALRVERETLDQQREHIAGAQVAWQASAAARQKLGEIAARQAGVQQAVNAAGVALAASEAALPALRAASAQAERSLAGAELACADSVVTLREQLADNEPCPVCGSAEHPYHDRGALLDQMLLSLRAEVARCRSALQDELADGAAQRALLASGADQLALLTRDHQAAAGALEGAEAEWRRHPLAIQAPADGHIDWLRVQQDANAGARRQLEAREQDAHRAARARDAAQSAYEQAAADHARIQERALAARQALIRSQADHAALQSKAVQAAESLNALLIQLDEALGWQDDWRDAWVENPVGLRAALRQQATRWREQSERARRLEAALTTQDAELAALQSDRTRTRQAADAESAAFTLIDTRFREQRSQRHLLWEGRAVATIERALADASVAARAALVRQHEAAQELVLAETRAREALEQTRQRLAALDGAQRQASSNLEDWLAQHAHDHPDIDTPADRAQLERMLGLDAAWLEQERRALGALDAGATEALTVLHERRRQLAGHLGERAYDSAAQVHVAQALEAVLAERAGIDGTAAALRLQLARDDERRERAKSVLAEIEAQQLIERRWGRMNELIGSSDGKKFRNYAQQFTLDVLLGYANRHLTQLARRYRLERVVNANGPSLALMVRDGDMGGEIRSVNSLSGGESFLVSLALALGLASLSSNRVRVESLFIDEGFGSLDSETLRVAMEALDALQSMGRKVGVISHVQEMTERIATRVMVQPAGAGASTVTVQ